MNQEPISDIVVPEDTFPLEIVCYDAFYYSFTCTVPLHDDQGRLLDWDDWFDCEDFSIAAGVLPFLVGEFGKPEEYVGRIFFVPKQKGKVESIDLLKRGGVSA